MNIVGLGKPIRVCADHIAVLACPGRCLGVELGELEELQAATHPGCAVCRIQPGEARPYFPVLRKCSRHSCYGRFHRSSYDETYLDERIAAGKRLLALFVRRLKSWWR
jgi:hypothetical protein